MSDRVAVVTGANGGLGFHTAVALARRGTQVVLACRSLARGREAQDALAAEVPGSETWVLPLDVSEPESIRDFRRRLEAQTGRLDLLVNNAGVVLLPLTRNSVGHELHLATNFLGAFALTGTLLPLFREGSPARVVNVGSLGHRFAKLDLEDLNWETTPYSEWKAYGRSKLALLCFTTELDRRLREAGSAVIALAAHPGFANTNAGRGTEALESKSTLGRWLRDRVIEPRIPKAWDAARPIVHAATAEDARGGDYYGPKGWFETRGAVGRARLNALARNADLGRRLWARAEEMTGVRFLSER